MGHQVRARGGVRGAAVALVAIATLSTATFSNAERGAS